MEKRLEDELNILKDIIVKTVPVECIYLFGSYAQGILTADADISLYVVMSDRAKLREIEAMKIIRRAIRDKKTLPVEVLVCKKSKFNQLKFTPGFEQQILKEGKMLYG